MGGVKLIKSCLIEVKGGDHLEELAVDGRLILQYILKTVLSVFVFTTALAFLGLWTEYTASRYVVLLPRVQVTLVIHGGCVFPNRLFLPKSVKRETYNSGHFHVKLSQNCLMPSLPLHHIT
jgi:CDP-diglyceride synthetase